MCEKNVLGSAFREDFDKKIDDIVMEFRQNL